MAKRIRHQKGNTPIADSNPRERGNALYLPDVRGPIVQPININDLPPDAVPIRLIVSDLAWMVWASRSALEDLGNQRQNCFAPDLKPLIQKIQQTFLEHRSWTYERWEYELKCHPDPANEVARWLRAADVCRALVKASAPELRADIVAVTAAWATVPPELVTAVASTRILRPRQVLEIIKQLFGPDFYE